MRRAGTGTVRQDGYIAHRRGDSNVLEHVLVAERAFGKPLPKGAQVHHWDRNRGNNSPTNLVICPNQAYHRFLHRRMEAMDTCGNPNWMPCVFCHHYDDTKNLYVSPNVPHAYHRACSAAYAKLHRAQLKAAAAIHHEED